MSSGYKIFIANTFAREYYYYLMIKHKNVYNFDVHIMRLNLRQKC